MNDKEINRILEWIRIHQYNIEKCTEIRACLMVIIKEDVNNQEMEKIFVHEENTRLVVGEYYKKITGILERTGTYVLFEKLYKAVEKENYQLADKIKRAIKYKINK